MKQLMLFCNLVSFLVLLVASAVFLILPGLLPKLGLSPDSARIFLLQLISLLLLLGSFQRNLSAGWRRFSLAGSFVVLGQALLLAVFSRPIGG